MVLMGFCKACRHVAPSCWHTIRAVMPRGRVAMDQSRLHCIWAVVSSQEWVNEQSHKPELSLPQCSPAFLNPLGSCLRSLPDGVVKHTKQLLACSKCSLRPRPILKGFTLIILRDPGQTSIRQRLTDEETREIRRLWLHEINLAEPD